jgi:STE24 endopeptidase
MSAFILVFLIALALTITIQFWLALRHIRHIQMHRGAVPQAFVEHIALPAHQKAADYSVAKTRLGMAHDGSSALLLLALTLGGIISFLDQLLRGAAGTGLIHGVALILLTLGLVGLLDIPFRAYQTFVIDARFGFNRTSPALFASDLCKTLAVSLLLGVPLAAAILWLMDEAGSRWWLYAWGLWMAFNVLILAIYPVFIAPLFNRFEPLPDATLKQRIEALLERCGFKVSGLFVMDGSKRTTHGNAYFTGLGKARRIVFYDTLITRLNEGEVEAVLAHELGHYRRHHILKRIALSFVVSLVGLWLLNILMQQDAFYHGLGVQEKSAAAALLLFLLVGPVAGFFLQPLVSLYSRSHEYEADQYACQQAHATDLIRALVKLYNDNAATLTPDPLHSAFYDSHPPASLRIAHLQVARQHG